MRIDAPQPLPRTMSVAAGSSGISVNIDREKIMSKRRSTRSLFLGTQRLEPRLLLSAVDGRESVGRVDAESAQAISIVDGSPVMNRSVSRMDRSGVSTSAKGPEGESELIVHGSEEADLIVISVSGGNIIVEINGSPLISDDAFYDSILIDGRGGDDSINLESNGDNPITLRGGAGTDTIDLTSTGGDLDAIVSAVTVEGGTEGAMLRVYDDVNAFSDPYTLSELSLTRNFFGGVSFIELNGLELHCQSVASTIEVQSGPAGPVMIYGSGGDDVCNVTGVSGNLEFLNGLFTFDGESGGDTIHLFDSTNPFDDSWTMIGNQISRPFIDPINCLVENVRVNMGTGNNEFTLTDFSQTLLNVSGSDGGDRLKVTGLPAGSTVIFNGENGSDTMSVEETSAGSTTSFLGGAMGDIMVLGFDTGDLANIAGAVNFDGEAGINNIVVWDDLNAGASDYTFDNSTLTRSEGFGGLSYQNMSLMTVNAQQGDNHFFVHSVPVESNLWIYANDGNDTADFGYISGSLVPIQSTVTFDGGNDQDVVTYADYARQDDVNYTFTYNALSGDGFPLQSFFQVESVVLYGSGGVNEINVSNQSNDGLPVQTVLAGGSDDLIVVGPSSTPVNLNGGAGLDQFILDPTLDEEGNSESNATAISMGVADELSSITISPGCTLNIADDHTITSPAELVLGTLSFGHRSSYIAVAEPVSMSLINARNYILAGYSGGAWTGMGGSFSSHASANSTVGDGIGYARAGDLGVEIYNEVSVGADDLIFTQTLYGDTDLDHVVDFNDLLSVAQHYNTNESFWSDGDFTYDSIVDFNDLLRVAQNYNGIALFGKNLIASNSVWRRLAIESVK